MKKILRVIFIFFLLLTGFSFIEKQKTLCGVWSAPVYSVQLSAKTGIDTLQLKRNGHFVLKKFSTLSLPGIYMGKWCVERDSLVLCADAGGMFFIDEKGKPITEKLSQKKTIKLSITIHSKEEIYILKDGYIFSRVNPVRIDK
ncbi:MAG: hypothetical protein IT236_11125 [Bacteroidia bacterium]|nr:hypothetical protein [Bacteroidia bacterium]